MTKCKETSMLKTENVFLVKRMFIWSNMYRVVNHSVKWAWFKFRLATFLKKNNFSGNFEQLVDRAMLYAGVAPVDG